LIATGALFVGVMDTVAELLPGLVSACPLAVTDAVFVIVFFVAIVPCSVSVAVVPLFSDPTVQMPVPALYVVPPLGVADVLDKPAGIASVTCTPVALTGPLLRIVTVYVTTDPLKYGPAGAMVFVTARSAAVTGVEALELLFPLAGSLVADVTLAVLTSGLAPA
jgi:hypothetical protein